MTNRQVALQAAVAIAVTGAATNWAAREAAALAIAQTLLEFLETPEPEPDDALPSSAALKAAA